MEKIRKLAVSANGEMIGLVMIDKKTTRINFAPATARDGMPVNRRVVRLTASKREIEKYEASFGVGNPLPSDLRYHSEGSLWVEFISHE